MLLLEIFNPFSVVLVGTGITAAVQGREAWMLADFFGSFLIGLVFFLSPKTNIKLDQVSLQMARALGCILLTSGLNAYAAYSSTEEEEKEAHVQSRIQANLVLLIAMSYAQLHYSEWSRGHIKIGFVGCIVWTLPYMMYFLTKRSPQRKQPNGRSVFLLLDQLATFVTGATLLAFPQWFLRHQVATALNGVSVHMARALGCLMVGSSLFSGAATSFTSSDSKKAVLLARGCGASLMALASIVSQVSGPFSTVHFLVGVVGTCCWVANSFLGYMLINYMTNVELMQNADARRMDNHLKRFSDTQQPFAPASNVSLTSGLRPFANAYDIAVAATERFNGDRVSMETSASASVNAALGRGAARSHSGGKPGKKTT